MTKCCLLVAWWWFYWIQCWWCDVGITSFFRPEDGPCLLFVFWFLMWNCIFCAMSSYWQFSHMWRIEGVFRQIREWGVQLDCRPFVRHWIFGRTGDWTDSGGEEVLLCALHLVDVFTLKVSMDFSRVNLWSILFIVDLYRSGNHDVDGGFLVWWICGISWTDSVYLHGRVVFNFLFSKAVTVEIQRRRIECCLVARPCTPLNGVVQYQSITLNIEGAVNAADAVGDNVVIDITDVAAVDGNELLSFLWLSFNQDPMSWCQPF